MNKDRGIKLYVVIFRAKEKDLDSEYIEVAEEMRDLALSEYGCIEFEAVSENGSEVALSYWQDLESIERWKSDSKHMKAQSMGKSKWYESYSVEIAEIKKSYKS